MECQWLSAQVCHVIVTHVIKSIKFLILSKGVRFMKGYAKKCNIYIAEMKGLQGVYRNNLFIAVERFSTESSHLLIKILSQSQTAVKPKPKQLPVLSTLKVCMLFIPQIE